MDRIKVVISKNWNHPEIRMNVSAKGIGIEIGLGDFLEALRQELDLTEFLEALRKEIGSVTYVFRQKTFDEIFKTAMDAVDKQKILDKLYEAASNNVVKGIKRESSKIVV